MRDGNGSIRIADPGKVPISDEDAATEKATAGIERRRSDKTYRQMLADINVMV